MDAFKSILVFHVPKDITEKQLTEAVVTLAGDNASISQLRPTASTGEGSSYLIELSTSTAGIVIFNLFHSQFYFLSFFISFQSRRSWNLNLWRETVQS